MKLLGTMRGLLSLAAAIALLALALPAAHAAEDIKIGVLTPLTAGATALGQEILRGAELGAQYVNERGGVLGGAKFHVISEDDAGQVEKAVAGYRKLVSQDGVAAVIGQVRTLACGVAAAYMEQPKGPESAAASGSQTQNETRVLAS